MKYDFLIIHQGALGDLILTLTAVNQALAEKPAGIFCRSGFIPLMRHLNISEQLYSVEDRNFSKLFEDIPSSRYSSLFQPYNHILLFSNSSILLKNIKSLTRAHVHQIPPRPDPDHRIHVVDFLVQQLDAIFFHKKSLRHDTHPAKPFKSSRVDGRILIHPGSGSSRKNWPLDNFVQIYRVLRQNKISTKWVTGPAEREKVEELKKFGIKEKDIYSNDNLVQFCRRLRNTGLFIGNDSGLSHLAAYCGTPVMTIFGPSDPIRWRPVGPDVTIVPPDTPCIPCFERKFRECDRPECFSGVTVEKVLKQMKSRCWI